MFITTCQLTLHDNLFYASREMGRTYETERYLHNYGLSYALGPTLNLLRPYFQASQVPSYQLDLASLARNGIYVTPARPLEFNFVFNTFKLGEPNYYSITVQSTQNKVIYGRAKELSAGSRFEFFILSKNQLPKLPRWVRLGKWMSKGELAHSGGDVDVPVTKPTKPVTLACPINPLDYSPANLLNFDIVNMPPVSLLINAVTTERCYDIQTDKYKSSIYLPENLAFFGAEVRK